KGKSGSIRWGGTWSGIGPAEWAWVMGYSRLDGGREPHTGNEWLLTAWWAASIKSPRSEEHTSELQSRENLVCRLLLETKEHATEPKLDIHHVNPISLIIFINKK